MLYKNISDEIVDIVIDKVKFNIKPGGTIPILDPSNISNINSFEVVDEENPKKKAVAKKAAPKKEVKKPKAIEKKVVKKAVKKSVKKKSTSKKRGK